MRNATRHGGCSAAHFILPTEKQEDFDELLSYWIEHYGSNNPTPNSSAGEPLTAAIQ